MHRTIRTTLALALVLGLASAASAQQWGNLKAKFVVKGKVPTLDKLVINKDQQFCGKHDIPNEGIVTGKNGELANVIIYLAPKAGQKVPVNPELAKNLPAEVRLDNANCRFEPHVVLLTTSQKLVLGNKDPVGHNSKGDLFANTAFNDLIPAGGAVKKDFEKAEKVPAQVTCSIHPWMGAWLMIKDDPYMGVSGEDGTVTIEKIPAGKWTFIVWQEKAGYVKGSQKGKDLGWKRGRVDVTITGGKDTDLGTIEVDAGSFKK